MGDGSFDGQGVNVACDARDEDVIEDICSVLREITKREPRRVVVGNMVRVYSCNQYWLPLLRSLGCLKPKMHVEGRTDGMNRKVCVPECIFRSPQNVVRQFLSALYECDGHAYKESPRVKLYSAHDEFLRDVQLLLLGFGIRAKFMKQTLRAGGTVKGGKRHEYTGRSLETPAAFANKFYSDVRFIGKRKQGTGKRQTSLKYSDMSLVDAVDKVVYTGVSEPVYDLTVSDSHRFSANGIEVHNCDDIEALQPKKDLVFDVVETEKQWKQRDGYTVWAITGEQIPERYHPDALEIDYETDRFRTTFQGTVQDITGKHSKELIWEFVPLKQPEEKPGSIFDSDLKLIVFRWPEPGYDYAVACDPSGGTGGDNSVISVMRRSIDGREPDEQVAEFASNRIPQAMLHPFILAIASLYSMEMNDVPLVAIENVYGTGDTAQIQMLEHGYKRHYKFSRLDGKNPKSDKKKSKRLGWYSFDWSRTFMLGQFVNAVHNGWLKLNSPFLLRNEMPAFQIEQTEKGKIRMDHESGKHDDRIFAAAIAYIVFNDTESMSKRVEHKFVGETVEVAVDYGWAQGLVIPYDQVWEGAI